MAAIEVEALERTFKGGIHAVAGIDLEVAEGEIYAFLGPNGAGKTTLVRMLTTLLRPTAGHARVAGHDVVDESAAVRRQIGVALQEAALDPLMSGNELVRLSATLHGIPRDRGRELADSLLERVGLTYAAERRVGTYSGGMARRLDLAMALVHSPRVLFLDEPTTGLDPTSRRAIWQEVRRLNDEGTTVFLTTQYLEEADQLADRVGIIADGKMAAEGTPDELKDEVGQPHLEVVVAETDQQETERVLAEHGTVLPRHGRAVCIEVEGAVGIAPIVRALDSAGLTVETLELRQPSLDDVFVEKTGQRLEGAADGSPGGAEADQDSADDRPTAAVS
ncbi:MAG: ATP-binding cassette domain-containing protein [Solirubrobacterales bacterium]